MAEWPDPAAGPSLELADWSRSDHQLSFGYRVGGLSFRTSLWYEGVNLLDLEDRYGSPFMRKLYFHIAAFDINKLQSLRPSRIRWGAFADLAGPPFAGLWSAVTEGAWAQWRYENDDPGYRGPGFDQADEGPSPPPIRRRAACPGPETLAFTGGGKDSLVSMKLLESASEPFDTLTYSVSSYGRSPPQHRLSDQMLDGCAQRHRRRMWIFDDFLDAPSWLMRPGGEPATLLAAETPASVFASLPFALRFGYKYLQVGHERSADVGQARWERTGETINHAWGKSSQAETLLNNYIRRELVADLCYYSVLNPVTDVLIFNLLRQHLDMVGGTHSCNNAKPWCCECPKCAYVWVNYMAWLPREIVDQMFDGRNLLDM